MRIGLKCASLANTSAEGGESDDPRLKLFCAASPQLANLAPAPTPRLANVVTKVPDEHWRHELARIIDNLSGQDQACVDAGRRESKQVGGLEQNTRSIQEAVQNTVRRHGTGRRKGKGMKLTMAKTFQRHLAQPVRKAMASG